MHQFYLLQFLSIQDFLGQGGVSDLKIVKLQ